MASTSSDSDFQQLDFRTLVVTHGDKTSSVTTAGFVDAIEPNHDDAVVVVSNNKTRVMKEHGRAIEAIRVLTCHVTEVLAPHDIVQSASSIGSLLDVDGHVLEQHIQTVYPAKNVHLLIFFDIHDLSAMRGGISCPFKITKFFMKTGVPAVDSAIAQSRNASTAPDLGPFPVLPGDAIASFCIDPRQVYKSVNACVALSIKPYNEDESTTGAEAGESGEGEGTKAKQVETYLPVSGERVCTDGLTLSSSTPKVYIIARGRTLVEQDPGSWSANGPPTRAQLSVAVDGTDTGDHPDSHVVYLDATSETIVTHHGTAGILALHRLISSYLERIHSVYDRAGSAYNKVKRLIDLNQLRQGNEQEARVLLGRIITTLEIPALADDVRLVAGGIHKDRLDALLKAWRDILSKSRDETDPWLAYRRGDVTDMIKRAEEDSKNLWRQLDMLAEPTVENLLDQSSGPEAWVPPLPFRRQLTLCTGVMDEKCSLLGRNAHWT